MHTFLLVMLSAGILFPVAYAQYPVPMKDKFYLESELKSQEHFLKSNTEFVTTFEKKFAAEKKLHDKHEETLKKLEALVAKIKSKNKHNKQEKAFLRISTCISDRYHKRKPNSMFSANVVSQCPYSKNVDPRLFRRTPNGKTLGDNNEVRQNGDELSKMFVFFEEHEPGDEEFTRIKNYKNSLEHKAVLEKGLDKSRARIEELQKLVAYRKVIDRKVKDLSDCKSELKLEIPALKSKHLDYGQAGAQKDILTGLTGLAISEDSVTHNYSKDFCKSFDFLKELGFCPVPKQEADCPNCSGKIHKDKSALEEIAFGESRCEDKKKFAKSIFHLSCEKSFVKAVPDFREKVLVNLVQGMPVVLKDDQKYTTVLGIRNQGGKCEYLIRNYPDGIDSWKDETDVLKGVREVTSISRRF